MAISLTDKNMWHLIFEKTSLPEPDVHSPSGHRKKLALWQTLNLAGSELQLGEKESIEDTARVLGRMFDGIEYRGFDHSYVEELAEHSGVPVWETD